jgi:eukaryotic-like serine/threonine-protein kinase
MAPDGGPLHLLNNVRGGSVESLATLSLGDRLLVAAAGDENKVALWSLPENYHDGLLTVPEGRVRDICLVSLDQRPLVVAATAGDGIRVWDGGWPLGGEFARHESGAYALAAAKVHGRDTVVSAGGDGTIRLWDLSDGAQVGEPIDVHEGRVRALAVAKSGRSIIAITGGEDGIVAAVDLAETQPVSRQLGQREGTVFAVALATVDRSTVCLSGGQDGLIDVRDITEGRAVRDPLAGTFKSDQLSANRNSAVFTLETADYLGQPVAISAGDDSIVRIFSLVTGDIVAAANGGHKAAVVSLATGLLRDHLVLFSGDEQGHVVAWDLAPAGFPRIGMWARPDFTGVDLPDPRPVGAPRGPF